MFKLDISETSRKRIDLSTSAFQEAALYRYSDQDKYTKILNDFYKDECIRRIRNYQKINTPDGIKAFLMYTSRRENLGNFIVDWSWTYDPRMTAIGLSPAIPWIPWQKQIDFLEWFYDLYMTQKGGLVEKSRDAGATWLVCQLLIFEWRWTQGFAGGIGSNKLDNVDDKNNPKSIFQKIRDLIRLLPKFWLPEGFNLKKHSNLGKLINPEMGSSINGDGGKEIGRGGRSSFYVVDEAASLDFPDDAAAALSQNTNCQIDLSTPKGMNAFGRKRHSGQVPVFTFNWFDDPRKNDEWLTEEEKRLDAVIVAQEIKINYQASVAGIFIKPEWVDAAIQINLKPVGVRAAGLDVAAGGSNKSSLYFRYGPVAKGESFNVENGTDLTHIAIDMCNKNDVGYMNYDRPGVGHAVHSAIERTERKMNFAYYGLNGGESASDTYYPEFEKTGKQVFLNSRCESWYVVSRRFEKTYEYVKGIAQHLEEELISIDNNQNLKAQLCSPKKMYTENGKMKTESKQQLMARGIMSPDEADALILAFTEKDGGQKHIIDQMDLDIGNELAIDWSLPAHRTKHYAAIVVNKDLSVHCLAAVWDQEDGILRVYSEFRTENPDAELITTMIIDRFLLNRFSVDKLLGNQWLFEDNKKSFQKEINNLLRSKINGQFIKLKESKKYDPLGSTTALMQLVRDKKFKVDSRCKEIAKQFFTWKLQNNKFEHDGMREAILMIISELMLYKPFKQKALQRPEYAAPLREFESSPMSV